MVHININIHTVSCKTAPCGQNLHLFRAILIKHPSRTLNAHQRPRKPATSTKGSPLPAPSGQHQRTYRATWTLHHPYYHATPPFDIHTLPFYHTTPPLDTHASRSGAAMGNGAHPNPPPQSQRQSVKPHHYHHYYQPLQDPSHYLSP